MTKAQLHQPVESSKANICAQLNDLCRSGELRQSRIVITRNCIERFCDEDDALSIFRVQAELSAKVRDHEFVSEDDPYGERDFGAFDHNNERLLWKIDYYDPSLSWHSEDPTDVTKTHRVLTIMLASDY